MKVGNLESDEDVLVDEEGGPNKDTTVKRQRFSDGMGAAMNYYAQKCQEEGRVVRGAAVKIQLRDEEETSLDNVLLEAGFDPTDFKTLQEKRQLAATLNESTAEEQQRNEELERVRRFEDEAGICRPNDPLPSTSSGETTGISKPISVTCSSPKHALEPTHSVPDDFGDFESEDFSEIIYESRKNKLPTARWRGLNRIQKMKRSEVDLDNEVEDRKKRSRRRAGDVLTDRKPTEKDIAPKIDTTTDPKVDPYAQFDSDPPLKKYRKIHKTIPLVEVEPDMEKQTGKFVEAKNQRETLSPPVDGPILTESSGVENGKGFEFQDMIEELMKDPEAIDREMNQWLEDIRNGKIKRGKIEVPANTPRMFITYRGPCIAGTLFLDEKKCAMLDEKNDARDKPNRLIRHREQTQNLEEVNKDPEKKMETIVLDSEASVTKNIEELSSSNIGDSPGEIEFVNVMDGCMSQQNETKCPICGSKFKKRAVQRHVERCMDEQSKNNDEVPERLKKVKKIPKDFFDRFEDDIL